MATTLHARQGDTLDALLWRDLGLRADALADVLGANPGLAALGPVLPTGTAVTVPDTAARAAPVRPLLQLWD